MSFAVTMDHRILRAYGFMGCFASHCVLHGVPSGLKELLP